MHKAEEINRLQEILFHPNVIILHENLSIQEEGSGQRLGWLFAVSNNHLGQISPDILTENSAPYLERCNKNHFLTNSTLPSWALFTPVTPQPRYLFSVLCWWPIINTFQLLLKVCSEHCWCTILLMLRTGKRNIQNCMCDYNWVSHLILVPCIINEVTHRIFVLHYFGTEMIYMLHDWNRLKGNATGEIN